MPDIPTESIETVYRPNQRHDTGFIKSLIIMAGNISRSREMIFQLYKRDFFASYKKSFIGASWVFIAPLVGIVSWVFFKKAGLLNPGDVGIPYPAYVLVGTSIWGLYMGFYRSSSKTLKSVAKMATQVNFPRESALFIQTGVHATNFIITLALNFIVLIAFGIMPSPWALALPLVVLPLFFVGASVGLLVAMISVVAYDIGRMIQAIMGLLLFITPVIYSDKIDVAWVKPLITYNPLTYLVCSARDIIIYGKLYNPEIYFLCAFLSFIFFLFALRLFYISENKLIERMLA